MNNIDLEKFIIGLSKVQFHCALGKVTLKDPINYALRSQNLQVDDDFKLTVLQDEPKFKVGNWIVEDSDGTLLLVKGVNRYTYELVRNVDDRPFERGIDSIEINCHIWTIKDAKAGDVLATKTGRPFIFKGLFDIYKPGHPVAYCGIDTLDDFILGTDNWWTDKNDVKPATKEQCDLLFQKMYAAGYIWNSRDKILMKKELDNLELTLYDWMSSDTSGTIPKTKMRECAIARAKEIREQLK